MPSDRLPAHDAAIVPIAASVTLTIGNSYGTALAVAITAERTWYLVAVGQDGPPVWVSDDEITSMRSDR